MHWEIRDHLSEELKTLLVSENYYPDPTNVFRSFVLTPLDKTKVVIIGQDPYPTKGVADGLAFSCGLTNKVQPSLAIINKAVMRELNCHDISTRADLTNIATQGVLLLNSALTIGKDKTNHFEYWHSFIVEIIKQVPEDVIFMLWGNHAKNLFLPFIKNDQSLIFTSIHPQAENYRATNVFYGKFKEVNQTLLGLGKDPIDWTL